MEDNELMARLARGEEEALAELIHRHRGAAQRQAEAMLQDAALAEDVVMEAFARVYLLRHRYRADFAFTTYLAVLVRRLCLDQWRKRRRGPVPLAEVPEGAAASAEAEYLRREGRLRLWQTLGELPEKDQALLTGFALDGLSYQALAKREGLTVGQVRIRLHRIRKKLRDKEDDGHE